MTDRRTAEVSYVGRRLTTKGRLGYFFQPSWYDDPTDITSWTGVKRSPGPIGGVFTVQHDGDPSEGLYLGSFQWTGEYKGSDAERLEWAAEDKACALQHSSAKARDRAAKESLDIGAMTLTEAHAWINDSRGGTRAARQMVVWRYLS